MNRTVITMLRDLDVTPANLHEFIELALATDWDAEYEATHKDGEPTDASAELGDMLEAVYWWAHDHHGGMCSPEYAILSAVGRVFSPGNLANGPEHETPADDMYRMLCDASEGAK